MSVHAVLSDASCQQADRLLSHGSVEEGSYSCYIVSPVQKSIIMMLLQISPRMWSLFPQLHQCYMEWGFNYLENLLVPLDNYISRGTDVFLSCKDPNYHAMVRASRPKAQRRSGRCLQQNAWLTGRGLQQIARLFHVMHQQALQPASSIAA